MVTKKTVYVAADGRYFDYECEAIDWDVTCGLVKTILDLPGGGLGLSKEIAEKIGTAIAAKFHITEKAILS